EWTKRGMLVVGAFSERTLPAVGARFDVASNGRPSALIGRSDIESKAGATALFHDMPGIAAERLLVVSLGTRETFGDKAFRDALTGTAKALRDGKAADAAVTLTAIDEPDRSLAWRTREAARMLAVGLYRSDAPMAN